MPIRVEWLDVTRPALAEATQYLRRRFARESSWDLSQVLVVVPGGRAGRRLLELLVDCAEREGLLLAPPEIVTLGGLPERLYVPKRPFASTLTQRLAWALALRATPREDLRPLLPRPPESDDDPAWLDWGDLLRKEHTELAADALDFARVADEVVKFGGAAEGARWRVLDGVQRRYLALLDSLELWDLQTARLVALEYREFQTSRPLVLIGTVDLNQTQRRMLDQIADEVTVLIPAAPEWRERFDSHGCLIPAAWSGEAGMVIELNDEQFTQVDGPEEQAEEVVRSMAAWRGKFRADEITVGFADEQLVPQVERQLRQCSVPARWGPGKTMMASSPFRLLEAIADWLERDSFPEWASLVRHPDVARWLEKQQVPADIHMVLDAYFAEHLPRRLEPESDGSTQTEHASAETTPTAETVEETAAATEVRADSGTAAGTAEAPARNWLGDSPRNQDLDRLYTVVIEWLSTLKGGPRPLPEWAQPVFEVVSRLYSDEFNLGNPSEAEIWQACQALRRTLEEFEAVPERLQPRVTATDAIRLALDLSRGESIPARADSTAVELLGWLELPLDDAPALIVTSFNEGHVPQSVNADPFLPNAVRGHLGLDDNSRRFARDAYAASVLRASRLSLRLIVARRDVNGDPLPPSRLLFATDVETIARRAARLFDSPAAATGRTALPGVFTPRLRQSTFERPEPAEILKRLASRAFDEPLRLSVSDFKSYLACPFRFLLQKAARCEPMTDDAREMDGGAFGSLAHDVLSAFGKRADLRDSRDADLIRAFLREQLQKRLHGQYGARPRPAVLVQAEQLRMRLDAFAELQARRVQEGWSIAHVEDERRLQEVSIDVDGEPFILVGRIDRVDLHGPTGRYGVFDYKTGDRGDKPAKTHLAGDERWIDLQLPLYRHLVRAMGVTGPVSLGYIVLPKDVSGVEVLEAEWDESLLAKADETAWEVVRRIRRREFEPSPDFRTGKFDDFARICLAGVLR